MISNAVVRGIDAQTAPDNSYLEAFERLVYQALL
jgi:hypothetical protein